MRPDRPAVWITSEVYEALTASRAETQSALYRSAL